MRRTFIFPAVFISCLIIIWVGTVAAAQMPDSPRPLTPSTNLDDAMPSDSVSKSDGVMAVEAAQSAQAPISCAISMNYPEKIQQWCNLITSAAQNTGLPANLIAAVILQESGGHPTILSHSGAVGLMQVMPRDGKAAEFMCINGPCFANRPTIAELQDPTFNISYGAQMLANLFAKHGSYREALYRYGPTGMGYHYADIVLKIWGNY